MGDPSRISPYFRVAVMQGNSLCNMDCSYCYLSWRKKQNLMSLEIATKVADDIARQAELPDSPDHVTVLWHCSEPLTMPKDHFRSLLSPFQALRKLKLVRFGIQTNATLVDDEWCEILAQNDFEVGVSIDGPEDMNAHRTLLGGQPAFDRIMRGIERLRNAGIEPSAIAVVTPETITRGRELIRWFHAQGFLSVAINIETREGANTDRPMITRHAARRFWYDVLSYLHDTGNPITVREIGKLGAFVRGDAAPVRDSIPTVTWDGDVIIGSPELAGVKAPEFNDFVAGNLSQVSIRSILNRRRELPYIAEFERALATCKETCSFWDVCHGGYAATRYGEYGLLNRTVTSACRNTRQAPVLAALDLAREMKNLPLVDKLHPLTNYI